MDDPSTFNLVGFGFVMYTHTHGNEFAPNAHVYLIVIAKLVEQLGLHLLLCRSPPLVSRLVFTGVIGLVMTVHYLYTVLCTSEYPLIHMGGRLTEVFVLSIIGLTLALHALMMYFVDGRINWHQLVFHRSNLPRSTDDFSLAVLKLGTACLHATKRTGLSCEIPSLDAPLRTYVEMRSDGRASVLNSAEDYEAMEVQALNGLGREVKDIRLALDHPIEVGGVVRGADKTQAVWAFMGTLKEVVVHLLFDTFQYVGQYIPLPAFVYRVPRYIRLFWHGTLGEARRMAHLADESAKRAKTEDTLRRIEASRARRQARMDDADDDDLNPLALVALAEEAQHDPSGLAAFQDMLVKHMVRPDHTPPLTRRAYRQRAATNFGRGSWLTSLTARTPYDESDRNTQQALLHLLQARRAAAATSADDRDRMRLCVVCCAEERTVVCWPCRCLALCNECRGTIATQQHARHTNGHAQHLCPTCRAPVEAYSRLYVP